MFRWLFYKPAGIEAQPDGARVQKWQRRSPRAWLLRKLIGKDRVLANLDLKGQRISIETEGKQVFLLGLATDRDSRISIT